MDNKIHINRNIVPGTCLVRLSGVLNEDFNKKEILQLQLTESIIVFDLDDVRRITSFGVREWLSAIKDINIESLVFINCRPAMISQFNMVAKFGGSGQVVTLYAPYSCPSCEKEIEVLIDLRKQYQDIIVNKNLPKVLCPTCQVEATFDDLPDNYFSYISAKPAPEIPPLAARLIENYKEKFSVQKDIDSNVTALWLSGPLDNSAHFKRTLDGLEGNIAVLLAGVTSSTPEGLSRLEGLTNTTEVKIYLCRVPMHFAASLTSKKVDIGKAKVISLWLTFGCNHCRKSFDIEVNGNFLSKRTTGGFGEHRCPHCEKQTNLQQLQYPGGWQILQAMRPILLNEIPADINGYLQRHPGIILSETTQAVPNIERTIIQPGGRSQISTPPPKSSGQLRAVGSPSNHRRCPICKSTYPLGVVVCPKDGNATELETAIEAADPFIGKAAGNYQISEKIGEGGMGAVYAAHHVNLGKKVAIKILHREYAQSKSLLERFFEEARAASQLGHENIVDVQDFGFVEGMQLPYFAMEFLEGQSLDTICEREEKLSSELAVKITLQLLDALTVAHKRGIVHRDLKPENIFLVKRRGNDYFVKLLDFGVAKLAHARAITQAGALIGTPHYMSPEQASGKNAEIDARADLYSVGVILYQLLCGVTPFQGTSFSELVLAHVSQLPKPPRSVNASISPALESVVLRALQKKPTDRFQNAEEMMRALQEAGTTQEPAQQASTPKGSNATPAPLPPPTLAPTRTPPPLGNNASVPAPVVSGVPAAPGSRLPLIVGGIGLLLGVIIALLIWKLS